MVFCTDLLPERLKNGVETLNRYFGYETGDGIVLNAEKGGELKVDFDGKKADIVYPSEVGFYRALGHILENGAAFKCSERARFDMCGAMYDHSRNGVLNMEYTKSFIARLAVLGINTYLMYMEDVYKIEGQPLFGYMRGAYSPEELKEIDDFAFSLGIEVIPCIQTLAHLNQFLVFDNIRSKYGDIDDILEVGDPDVCELIDSMFATMKKCFRTTRIHAGMDEAYFVGRGKYLDHNGYQSRKEVMCRQIDIVSKTAKKYGYDVLMWDDMFYRGEGSELTGSRPDNIHLVYWNYYDESTDDYLDKLDIRLSDDPDTLFAGGAWRWGGAVPCHRKTRITTEAALRACIERGVRNVFTTLWGDDGSETPVDTGMFGVTMFAEFNYCGELGQARFDAKLKWLTGMNYAEWMLQDNINNFADVCKHDNCFEKYAFYQDPLCGLHDEYIRYAGEQADLTAHYGSLAEKFDALDGDVSRYYAALCRALKLKWDLGVRLCDAYKNGDKDGLRNIIDGTVIPLTDLVEEVRKCRFEIWMRENKAEGFEILDIRYGGLIARLKTVRTTVERYLAGEIDEIAPLKAERLLHTGEPEIMRMCFYSHIASNGASW